MSKPTVVKLVQPEPCDCVVAQLEEMLAEAKAGKILCIATATLETSGEYSVGFVGPHCPLALLGAVTVLQSWALDAARPQVDL